MSEFVYTALLSVMVIFVSSKNKSIEDIKYLGWILAGMMFSNIIF